DTGQTPATALTPGPPNNVVHITVSIFQTCTTGGNQVAASVKGTTLVDVACATDGNLGQPAGCLAAEQLNTLHLTCTGVSGSTCPPTNDGNGNPTIAAITYTDPCPGGGNTCKALPFGTFVQIATITATTVPGQQVFSPASGEFAVTANTGSANVFSGSI